MVPENPKRARVGRTQCTGLKSPVSAAKARPAPRGSDQQAISRAPSGIWRSARRRAAARSLRARLAPPPEGMTVYRCGDQRLRVPVGAGDHPLVQHDAPAVVVDALEPRAHGQRLTGGQRRGHWMRQPAFTPRSSG